MVKFSYQLHSVTIGNLVYLRFMATESGQPFFLTVDGNKINISKDQPSPNDDLIKGAFMAESDGSLWYLELNELAANSIRSWVPQQIG